MTQEFLVVGAHPVLGVQPGGHVNGADAPSEQIARLVARGSLQPVVPESNKAVRDTDSGKEQD